MSELKCPFCQQELKPQTMDGEWLECWNCSYHEPSHHPFPQRILCGTKELWQALIDTKKKLDACVKALNKIANTDIKVIEKEPLYYARAMFSVTNNALGRIQDIEQTKDKE